MFRSPPILTASYIFLALVWSHRACAESEIDFNRDIRPILSDKCFACHGPDDASREANLRLDDSAAATSELDSGTVAIKPGSPSESELVRRITSTDESEQMPPHEFGKPLAETEIKTLRIWIEQGANYAKHWSFEKPQPQPLPLNEGEQHDWPRNEIDHFTLAAMGQHGLHPSPEADRTALARRVYLDLTGLPPTPEEAAAFASDNDPLAYEKMVDELLQRPTYGEHWARLWLDLARYADSAGYADDQPRTIWAYRDWVIRALNANMPFDQFTVEQLAGDLLPNPKQDQLIATAFHRNTLTNNEGGTQDEEFRDAAVVDRVNTTMSVWMGITFACAQCHNHKYDPVSQREYYGIFAIFNNTEDADRQDEAPVLQIFTDKQRKRQPKLQSRLAVLQIALSSHASIANVNVSLWPKLFRSIHDTQPTTTAPILRELATPRETRISLRGNYLDKGNHVEPGTPAVFHAATTNGPMSRLQFARWLVDANNPLTARVIVNRYWESLFDRGLVATSDDFGSQGEQPSHPELLDWLALKFMNNGWDIRSLLRTIVTSATYRQSSRQPAESPTTDPENRWLARGPRKRASAEMVRDQALFASGLLSSKMFGPPVRPPQPTMGLAAAFGGSTDWQTSVGEDRYRRAIYTTWRRSNPYPSMATFDAPNREVCTLRRTVSNTPLQSLVTLNDPVYMEAAQHLARKALAAAPTLEEQLAFAYRRCVQRSPNTKELESLTSLYHYTYQRLAARKESAVELATIPLGDLPPNIDPVAAASMTVACNVLLNLDEMFLKR